MAERGALTPRASKWLERAEASFQRLDMEDASDSAKEALREAPQDQKARLLAARIALARLDYATTVKLTENMTDSKALGLRARALWYEGDIRQAGLVLEQLLHDPEVHDAWAKEVSKLTNRGAGREPFRVDGTIVAAVDMAPVAADAMVVPVEIDGEQGLALIATGTPEVVLDSAQRKEPSWISLRFDGRVEYHDVPALTQDLSSVSHQLGAPIKALLGIHFLRRANPTFDLQGRQFVVRRFEPPRPPDASELPVYYARGGGMLVSARLGAQASAPRANFFVDTSLLATMSLTSSGMQKAQLSAEAWQPLKGAPGVKQGTVPLLRVGVFDLPQTPALTGVGNLESMQQTLGIPIDGVLGAGVIGQFRVTLTNAGRSLWLEKDYGNEAAEEPTAPTAQPPQESSSQHEAAPSTESAEPQHPSRSK